MAKKNSRAYRPLSEHSTFVNTLRECLDLEPLYQSSKSASRPTIERFFREHEEPTRGTFIREMRDYV